MKNEELRIYRAVPIWVLTEKNKEEDGNALTAQPILHS